MSFTVANLPVPAADDVAFDALLECFRLTGRFANAESLRVFTHCPIEKLVAAGWLVEGQMGRWLEGYVPAGALRDALNEVGRAAPRAPAPSTSAPPRLCG